MVSFKSVNSSWDGLKAFTLHLSNLILPTSPFFTVTVNGRQLDASASKQAQKIPPIVSRKKLLEWSVKPVSLGRPGVGRKRSDGRVCKPDSTYRPLCRHQQLFCGFLFQSSCGRRADVSITVSSVFQNMLFECISLRRLVFSLSQLLFQNTFTQQEIIHSTPDARKAQGQHY